MAFLTIDPLMLLYAVPSSDDVRIRARQLYFAVVNERMMLGGSMDSCEIAVEVAIRCAGYFVRTNIPVGWEGLQQELMPGGMAAFVPLVPRGTPVSPDVSAVDDQAVSNDTVTEAREESVAPIGDGIDAPTGMDLFPGSG